jgi:hypothetical protein
MPQRRRRYSPRLNTVTESTDVVTSRDTNTVTSKGDNIPNGNDNIPKNIVINRSVITPDKTSHTYHVSPPGIRERQFNFYQSQTASMSKSVEVLDSILRALHELSAQSAVIIELLKEKR